MNTYTDSETGFTYHRHELLELAGDIDVHEPCGIRHDIFAIACDDPDLLTALAAQYRACRAMDLDAADVLGPGAPEPDVPQPVEWFLPIDPNDPDATVGTFKTRDEARAFAYGLLWAHDEDPAYPEKLCVGVRYDNGTEDVGFFVSLR